MTKTYKFNYCDGEFLLTYSQPGKEGTSFSIKEETMEFNTTKFYEYVFQDVYSIVEIKVNNEMVQDKIDVHTYKKGLRVYQTIVDLCAEISKGINEKCFLKNLNNE